MGLPHDHGWTTPFDNPFYPPLPAHYRNVRFQMVFFRADPATIARFLPAPLTPDPEGRCVAMGIQIPFCTSYGAFNEAALELKCSFRGEPGWYCSHVWHDGPSGIAAGREIYGTPKIFSALDIQMAERTMLTRASMGGLPVVTVSSTMEHAVPVTALPVLTPAWRLKLIPRADGPGPALKQLIDCTSATTDFEAHACYRGRGIVKLEPSPLCDVTSLAPQTYDDAFYMEASYTETFATIAYDYLQDGG